VAERAAVGVRLKALVQQCHLRLTQQQPVRELVEQEVGLVHERRAGSVPLKVVAARGKRGGWRARLGDGLALALAPQQRVLLAHRLGRAPARRVRARADVRLRRRRKRELAHQREEPARLVEAAQRVQNAVGRQQRERRLVADARRLPGLQVRVEQLQLAAPPLAK